MIATLYIILPIQFSEKKIIAALMSVLCKNLSSFRIAFAFRQAASDFRPKLQIIIE